ncbi:MAG: hypothetical protein ACTSPB_25415 [Candidatus Thorarchaeota archaeon]|nr:MAG: hypothetical protein B6U90_02455 [Thermoplasmatales archaeon ex4484_6]RKX53907.1 MAG: hypothetical protein DRP24_06870 [Thermotoga sp.]RLF69617.1 MAG: hypothetical protein DRN57_00340 [Thermoplasmata archaeon]
MAYTVMITIPFENWTKEDDDAIIAELGKFNIECFMMSPASFGIIDPEGMIHSSDLVVVIYTELSFMSELTRRVIDISTGAGKNTLIIKERGVPMRGHVSNVDIVEFDPDQPGQAVAYLLQYTKNTKSERDAKIGKAIVGWTLGLGLAAGIGYLLYKALKE